uniref:GIY-YIG homing endonuclease n=1 Tax=Fomitiporia mediterranea TaxID=208960 RepID=A0A5B9R9N5_9AGAM|nr:GIY-YIG homing endonuclease [Fomitiporia mediterranea]QEG57062.1 GIY-YIG homing endonuclease [Fomitiporia mediterranea]
MLILNSIFFIKAKNRIKPVKVYKNFLENKLNIKTENKHKIGIYYLINLSNGHDYVGKSKNLAVRLNSYLNVNKLIKNKNMLICKALLDFNSNNFAVFIIEYTDLENLNKRENFWISKLDPQYNIIKPGKKINKKINKNINKNIKKNRSFTYWFLFAIILCVITLVITK